MNTSALRQDIAALRARLDEFEARLDEIEARLEARGGRFWPIPQSLTPPYLHMSAEDES